MFAENAYSSDYFTASLGPHRKVLACDTSIVYDNDKGSSEYSTVSLDPKGKILVNGTSIVYRRCRRKF